MSDEQFLEAALEQAADRPRRGRGAGRRRARGRRAGARVGRNRRVQLGSAISHGETDALENAGRQPAAVYRRATMVTTLSPCDMCTGAILLYGIPRVVIGDDTTFRRARGAPASKPASSSSTCIRRSAGA